MLHAVISKQFQTRIKQVCRITIQFMMKSKKTFKSILKLPEKVEIAINVFGFLVDANFSALWSLYFGELREISISHSFEPVLNHLLYAPHKNYELLQILVPTLHWMNCEIWWK